jgi:hypothetical protein
MRASVGKRPAAIQGEAEQETDRVTKHIRGNVAQLEEPFCGVDDREARQSVRDSDAEESPCFEKLRGAHLRASA